jgi:hypothetical protein
VPKFTPAQTTEWVASSLKEADKVEKVEVLSDRVLRVFRDEYDPFLAGIVSAPRVEATTIEPVVKSGLGVEIIANVPKEAYWTGSALDLASANAIATGSLGDLYRALRMEDIRGYQPAETEFVERSLRQHTKVTGFRRLHDRLYRVSRHGLSDLDVVMLNEYELTADQVRTARDRYGKFSDIVITNPNGTATSSAEQAAEGMGAQIYKWGPFLGRLNKK